MFGVTHSFVRRAVPLEQMPSTGMLFGVPWMDPLGAQQRLRRELGESRRVDWLLQEGDALGVGVGGCRPGLSSPPPRVAGCCFAACRRVEGGVEVHPPLRQEGGALGAYGHALRCSAHLPSAEQRRRRQEEAR